MGRQRRSRQHCGELRPAAKSMTAGLRPSSLIRKCRVWKKNGDFDCTGLSLSLSPYDPIGQEGVDFAHTWLYHSRGLAMSNWASPWLFDEKTIVLQREIELCKDYMAVHDDVYIDVTADRRCRLLLCGVASPPLSAIAVWSRLSAAIGRRCVESPLRRYRPSLCGVASPPLLAVAVWSRLSAAVRLATAQQVLQKIQDYLQIQSLEFKINCVYLLKVKHRNRID